jgi:dsDNA-specific endonuclease/ATPase MutS2
MENLPDDINELFNEIENREYPPDEEYFKFKAELEHWIEFRNRLAKKIKYLSPTKQRIKRLQLIDFDNKIAQAKQGLKKFYESSQEVERAEEKETLRSKLIDRALNIAERASEKLYVIIKHRKPHLFEEFHKISTQDMTPEELQEFNARIKHLEATKLNDILEGKE